MTNNLDVFLHGHQSYPRVLVRLCLGLSPHGLYDATNFLRFVPLSYFTPFILIVGIS